ncbi:universal stress protein [Nocardia asteroides]|uniref:universal stress protein n=1 Tax=Nocardia asteroides TaxID=1824 RepID=UPI00340172E8
MFFPDTQGRVVVVGVDGSSQARIALRWAAEFAAHHRAPLHLVTAVEIPVDYGPGLSGPLFDGETLCAQGESVVAEAARQVPDGLIVSTAAEVGDARAVLRRHSESARLLVVGSRGLGALRRTLLGSVSTAVARHAVCPVAVVPEPPVPSAGAVVVGVDGSGDSACALTLAFDEASRRGVRLIAVRAWSEFFRYEARETMQAEAEAELSASLAGYREKFPDVLVERIVVEDRPARAILTAAAGAQLIVVGSRGRGGAVDPAIGSVAQAVLHGAPCPLLIVRPESEPHG